MINHSGSGSIVGKTSIGAVSASFSGASTGSRVGVATADEGAFSGVTTGIAVASVSLSSNNGAGVGVEIAEGSRIGTVSETLPELQAVEMSPITRRPKESLLFLKSMTTSTIRDYR
tara:strand:- start:467 stop:814 length:348 start_codon:yes stop_codon:yes gene_type:complete